VKPENNTNDKKAKKDKKANKDKPKGKHSEEQSARGKAVNLLIKAFIAKTISKEDQKKIRKVACPRKQSKKPTKKRGIKKTIPIV